MVLTRRTLAQAGQNMGAWQDGVECIAWVQGRAQGMAMMVRRALARGIIGRRAWAPGMIWRRAWVHGRMVFKKWWGTEHMLGASME